MDYEDAWMLLKERVKADASTPPACVMWVQGVIATVEQDLAVMEPHEPRDIAAGGALALAGGNALGLMRMEERVHEIEKRMKNHDIILDTHIAKIDNLTNNTHERLEKHDKKFKDQDGINKAILDDMKRLIGIIEAHVKKGFWG